MANYKFLSNPFKKTKDIHFDGGDTLRASDNTARYIYKLQLETGFDVNKISLAETIEGKNFDFKRIKLFEFGKESENEFPHLFEENKKFAIIELQNINPEIVRFDDIDRLMFNKREIGDRTEVAFEGCRLIYPNDLGFKAALLDLILGGLKTLFESEEVEIASSDWEKWETDLNVFLNNNFHGEFDSDFIGKLVNKNIKLEISKTLEREKTLLEKLKAKLSDWENANWDEDDKRIIPEEKTLLKWVKRGEELLVGITKKINTKRGFFLNLASRGFEPNDITFGNDDNFYFEWDGKKHNLNDIKDKKKTDFTGKAETTKDTKGASLHLAQISVVNNINLAGVKYHCFGISCPFLKEGDQEIKNILVPIGEAQYLRDNFCRHQPLLSIKAPWQIVELEDRKIAWKVEEAKSFQIAGSQNNSLTFILTETPEPLKKTSQFQKLTIQPFEFTDGPTISQVEFNIGNENYFENKEDYLSLEAGDTITISEIEWELSTNANTIKFEREGTEWKTLIFGLNSNYKIKKQEEIVATWEEVFGDDEEAQEKILAWKEVGFKDPKKAQNAAEKGWKPDPKILKAGVYYPDEPHLPAGVFYRSWEITPKETIEAEINRVFPDETERTEFLELKDELDENVNIYKLRTLKENGYRKADADKLKYTETTSSWWVEYSIIEKIRFNALNWNKKAVELYSPIREKIETAELEINERWAKILPNWNTTAGNLRKQLATYLLEFQGRNWQPKEFKKPVEKIKDQVYREEAIKWKEKGGKWNDDLISEEARIQIFSAPVVKIDFNLGFVRSVLNYIQKVLEWKEENIEGLELEEEIEKISDELDELDEKERELINTATDNLLEKARQKLVLIDIFKKPLSLDQLYFYQKLREKLKNGENDFKTWAWKNIFVSSERAKEVAEENCKKLEAWEILENWTKQDFWKDSTVLRGEEHYSTEAKNNLKVEAETINKYQEFILRSLSDNEEEQKEAKNKILDIRKELGLEEDFETLKKQFEDLYGNIGGVDERKEIELMKELKNKMLNHSKKGEYEADLKTIQLNYYGVRLWELIYSYKNIEESKYFESLIKSINKYRTPDESEKGVLKRQIWESDLEKKYSKRRKKLKRKKNKIKNGKSKRNFLLSNYRSEKILFRKSWKNMKN